MDFEAYALLKSTIFDNGGAVHLVNDISYLEESLFRLVKYETVEAGTQVFPILGRGTRVIPNALNGPRGPKTEDLVLTDVVLVEGFHVNIISEAQLLEAGVWFLRLDATLRFGSLEKSVILAKLLRKFNLTFLEYKPSTPY